jgi:hypothetical protein
MHWTLAQSARAVLNVALTLEINMVFNTLVTDAELIEHLGGPAAVAGLLGYDKAKGGTQRVHNWKTRGIPDRVKVRRPDLFLADLSQRMSHIQPSPSEATHAQQ